MSFSVSNFGKGVSYNFLSYLLVEVLNKLVALGKATYFLESNPTFIFIVFVLVCKHE